MPAPSQAALRRKLQGLEPEKSPKHVEAGRKAAKVKLGKTDQQIRAKQAGLQAKGVPRGGKAALLPLQKILTDDQQLASFRVKAIANRNAEEAVNTLVRLMNGTIEAPAAVRRMAALDILELAGAGKDGINNGEKPLEEMTLAELQSFINQQVEKLDEIEDVEIVLDDQPEPATDDNRQPD